MGLSVAIMLSVLCTTMVTAISPQQAKYEDNIYWQKSNTLSYSFQLANRFNVGDNDSSKSKYYLPTVGIHANITYNITDVSGTVANVTEKIFNINITYNPSIIATRKPYIAEYNSSVSMDNFLADIENELAANRSAGATKFYNASHYSNYVMINTTNTILPDITNTVKFYKNNGTAMPLGTLPVINRFIVSSNISGNASLYTPELNESSPATMKVLRFGLFYTPLAFALSRQNGSFWMNQAWNESRINNFGLWSKNKIANASMGFNDNETWSAGITSNNPRWVGKFSTGYAKVGGWEQSFFDSQTGILMLYQTIQTRWDGYVGNTYYSNVQPQALTISLIGASSSIMYYLSQSNATQGVPGYPVVALLVAVGIGAILARRKLKH